MSKFLTKEESEIFFAFLKKRLCTTKAGYARTINKHPVTISIQFKREKVKKDQVKQFLNLILKPIESFL